MIKTSGFVRAKCHFIKISCIFLVVSCILDSSYASRSEIKRKCKPGFGFIKSAEESLLKKRGWTDIPGYVTTAIESYEKLSERYANKYSKHSLIEVHTEKKMGRSPAIQIILENDKGRVLGYIHANSHDYDTSKMRPTLDFPKCLIDEYFKSDMPIKATSVTNMIIQSTAFGSSCGGSCNAEFKHISVLFGEGIYSSLVKPIFITAEIMEFCKHITHESGTDNHNFVIQNSDDRDFEGYAAVFFDVGNYARSKLMQTKKVNEKYLTQYCSFIHPKLMKHNTDNPWMANDDYKLSKNNGQYDNDGGGGWNPVNYWNSFL